MNHLVVSHALEDVSSDPFFENDEESLSNIKQLAGGLGQDAALVNSTAAAELRPAPPRGPKPYADVPLPPPERPLKWHTKLADRATAAVNLEAHYQVPPHMLFELLADPTQHDKIFDAILAADSELLEEDGCKRKWRLDYTARWAFWKVSGVCENRLYMWTDSEAGTVTFKLREPGFLKRYEGTWTITAGCGSPLAAFSTSTTAAANSAVSPASSTYDLRSSSSSSSGSSSAGSSRGGSPGSSPRSSWADGLPTADIFGAHLSRNGSGASGTSSGSSISLRTLPLASVSTAATASGLPQTLGQTVYSLSSTISSAMWSLLGYNSTGSGSTAALADSSSSQQWPPLFKPSSPLANAAGSFSALSSLSSSSSSTLQGAPMEAPKLRPMPTSAIIMASTLTSPKLTPPYPINQCLKIQSKGQVEEMLEGLVRAATAKLQSQPLQGV